MRAALSILLATSMVCFLDAPLLARSSGRLQGQSNLLKAEPAPPGAGQSPALVLEDGMPVLLELSHDLSSADASEGNRVEFEVIEDVKVNDAIVIAKGAVAMGTITMAKHSRRLGRGGKMDMAIETVKLVDGARAPLRAVKKARGGGEGGDIAGSMAASAFFFPLFTPFFLMMHGNEVRIPEGTEVTAYVQGPIVLDAGRFVDNEVARKAIAETHAGSRRESKMISFEVKSTPEGADIQVDGKPIGITPYTLRLRSGSHTLKLNKRGYEDWEEAIAVGKDATTGIDVMLPRK
jgi:PEGA domain-containing protein